MRMLPRQPTPPALGPGRPLPPASSPTAVSRGNAILICSLFITVATVLGAAGTLLYFDPRYRPLAPWMLLGAGSFAVGIIGIVTGLKAMLREERQRLAVQLFEHDRDMQAAHLAQMAQISRFAEFGKLAGGIFHDIVNPLTAVTLTVEQINQLPRTTPSRSQLQRLRRSVRRIEQFMTAARRQLQQQPVREHFCLNEEIETAIDITAYKAKRALVTVHFFAEHQVYLYGNPVKCYQAISNLISNAIDAYDDQDDCAPIYTTREVWLTVQRTARTAELVVRDWGIGIPPEHLDRIFDPFFTTKEMYRGTGIGLAVCKEAVEKECGGSIMVKSTPGKGTTFTLTFPLLPI